MATQSRRKSSDLIEKVKSEPYDFNFFQVIRLLQNGQLTGNECSSKRINFIGSNSLAFNGSDIKRIEPESNGWTVEVSLLGLTGSQGVLPYHFSELIVSELRVKGAALRDFFDILNNRSIHIFYEAWKKYQLTIAYEQRHLNGNEDYFTDSLLALCGLGKQKNTNESMLDDEPYARFAAHLGREVCSVEYLRGSLNELLGLEIEIEQFKGEWFDLDTDSMCQFPSAKHPNGVNNALGASSVLGRRCYQVQNRFTIVIVPKTEEEFERCAPGSAALEKLKRFVRLSVGVEQDFDIEIRALSKHLSLQNVCRPTNHPVRLGWNSVTNPLQVNRESITIHLSQDM